MIFDLAQLLRSPRKARATFAASSVAAGALGFSMVLFGVFVAR